MAQLAGNDSECLHEFVVRDRHLRTEKLQDVLHRAVDLDGNAKRRRHPAFHRQRRVRIIHGGVQQIRNPLRFPRVPDLDRETLPER